MSEERAATADTTPHGEAPRRPDFAGMIRSPHQCLALMFGLGLAPRGPGTFGSLAGFALFAAMRPLPLAARIAVYLALIALASVAAARTGRDLGAHDHNAIVIDETIGMALTLEFVAPSWLGFGLAFVLFRLFDTWKPWPVYLADQARSGGFMVVFDDILAAGWAAICLVGLHLAGIV